MLGGCWLHGCAWRAEEQFLWQRAAIGTGWKEAAGKEGRLFLCPLRPKGSRGKFERGYFPEIKMRA